MFLTRADIRQLMREPKAVPERWDKDLLATAQAKSNAQLELLNLATGPMRGHLSLFVNIPSGDQFSVGITFTDLGGESLNLIRMNGPHPHPHTNRWPIRRAFAGQCHIHHLTELHQRKRSDGVCTKPDGFAVVTRQYDDVEGALAVMARRAMIMSQGRMTACL